MEFTKVGKPNYKDILAIWVEYYRLVVNQHQKNDKGPVVLDGISIVCYPSNVQGSTGATRGNTSGQSSHRIALCDAGVSVAVAEQCAEKIQIV